VNILESGGIMEKTRIYVKDGCPYCAAALEDLEKRGVDFQMFNVKQDPKAAEEALKHSNGQRMVPIIVQENGEVQVGFNGG
jgi:glutaredoxin